MEERLAKKRLWNVNDIFAHLDSKVPMYTLKTWLRRQDCPPPEVNVGHTKLWHRDKICAWLRDPAGYVKWLKSWQSQPKQSGQRQSEASGGKRNRNSQKGLKTTPN